MNDPPGTGRASVPITPHSGGHSHAGPAYERYASVCATPTPAWVTTPTTALPGSNWIGTGVVCPTGKPPAGGRTTTVGYWRSAEYTTRVSLAAGPGTRRDSDPSMRSFPQEPQLVPPPNSPWHSQYWPATGRPSGSVIVKSRRAPSCSTKSPFVVVVDTEAELGKR